MPQHFPNEEAWKQDDAGGAAGKTEVKEDAHQDRLTEHFPSLSLGIQRTSEGEKQQKQERNVRNRIVFEVPQIGTESDHSYGSGCIKTRNSVDQALIDEPEGCQEKRG